MDDMKKTDYRVEKDSIGVKDIPEEVYYGVQTLRAAENFHITGLNMHPEIINSLAYIKKSVSYYKLWSRYSWEEKSTGLWWDYWRKISWWFYSRSYTGGSRNFFKYENLRWKIKMKITYDICPRVLGLWGFVFITQERFWVI